MQFRRAAPLALLLGACGGGGTGEPTAAAGPATPATITDVRRQELAAHGVSGLSDLAVDPQGRVWAVAERVRVALRVDRPGAAPVAVPLLGVPDELDIEGMAWLDRETVALATEADVGARTGDVLLIARLGDRGLEVIERRELDYKLWPLDPIGNQGLEGLCRAGGALVASVETVIAEPDRRFAPIALHDLASGRWTPGLVRLTTRTGKISALACVPGPDHSIDVLAIERHFEVARLIRFSVPADLSTRPLEPVVVADLGTMMIRQENFEGLIWDGGRTFSVVVDNDWTHVTGPNLMVSGRLHGALPAPR